MSEFKPRHQGDDEGYLYHDTNHERAHEIASSGKLHTHKPSYGTDQHEWPDGATEKRSYFSSHKDEHHSFAPEGKVATLRVHHTKGEFHTEHGTGDVYSKKPIAAHHLEIEHEGSWHPLHKFFNKSEDMDEALEPHERRHAVLSRLGWHTKNLHHYTHDHLPGHVITSHPKSKEWTHHVVNPFNKQPERHGSGQWPGGHSFTGYLHDVHDRAHTSKAPSWRPMPDRTNDCPHCARGVPHTDAQHSQWMKKESVDENRFLHRGHQSMHDIIQSLGYTREQPRADRKEDFAPTAVALTKSTYVHAHTGNKAMVLSHMAHPQVTVVLSPKEGTITKRRGTPESMRKFLMGSL